MERGKKKYVIMAATLSGMGGAQMYIRSKMLFLRSHGWDVDIIAAQSQNVIIPELNEFKKNTFPELQYNKYYYGRWIQKQVMNQLKTIIIKDNKYEDIVIESTIITQSTWAESLARIVGARHLVYLLQEHNVVVNRYLCDFFIFKHSRHELAGIKETTLIAMFQPFHPLKEDESYRLSAHCTNVEADIEHPLLHSIDKKKYDYVIGVLSRLDKPFVSYALNDIYNYIDKQREKRFLLLWIGDAPEGSKIPDRVKNLFSQIPNVDVIITGYLYPVPTRLLGLCDVFISSAGSSHVCRRSGIPTICYDGNDYKPIGVLGRTTNNSLFRDSNEPPQSLDNLLYQVLVDNKYEKIPPSYRIGLPDFQSHLDFLDLMSREKDYYNTDEIHLETRREKRVALGLKIFGPNGYTWLHKIKNRMFN